MPPRATAICWPTTFMNREAPCRFVVPKSAYCWPLMALSAAGPAVVLSTLSALEHVVEVAGGAGDSAWSSAAPTAYWLAVCAPAAKAP